MLYNNEKTALLSKEICFTLHTASEQITLALVCTVV